jgi:hypothetical protein
VPCCGCCATLRLPCPLHPPQVEGVRFLYEAVMGLRGPGQTGAILADDMGLGKTLQVLALLWTLLKQGPEVRGGEAGLPPHSAVLNNKTQPVREGRGQGHGPVPASDPYCHPSDTMVHPNRGLVPPLSRAVPWCARRWWSRPPA